MLRLGLPPLSLVALLFAANLLTARTGRGADWAVEQVGPNVRVLLGSEVFTEYLTDKGPKPILWPIHGPGGHAMSRAYPMLSLDGEKHDHPHHRSLWFTHGDVNDVDFWAEGEGKGRIAHVDYLALEADGKRALIRTRNDWLAPDGRRVCQDERTIVCHGDATLRMIDFDVSVTATDGLLRFGDTKEGSLGIRVPSAIDVDQKTGGRNVNSEGQTEDDAWGQAARWVDYSGPLAGGTRGVAMLQHPTSFRYPARWHVRTYGLFAANPFGLHDFLNDERQDGSLTLQPGESLRMRYRFVFHDGDAASAKVEQLFKNFAAER